MSVASEGSTVTATASPSLFDFSRKSKTRERTISLVSPMTVRPPTKAKIAQKANAAPTNVGPHSSSSLSDFKDDDGDVQNSTDIDSAAGEMSTAPQTAALSVSQDQNQHVSYEHANLEAVTMRQIREDLDAYERDMRFTQDQLQASDLTPQEARSLQLRCLDYEHHSRHCKHRMEIMSIQRAQRNSCLPHPQVSAGHKRPAPSQGPCSPPARRIKPSPEGDEQPLPNGEQQNYGRCGFWKCRLCTSTKYQQAGAVRQPAQPCKWPLKDISKMIAHFLDKHVEHTAAERCIELGDALTANLGPFEYWLTKTRAHKLEAGEMEECIEELGKGQMAGLLRKVRMGRVVMVMGTGAEDA